MKQRCLVLGGGGFIGKHLCQALLNNGYATRVFDKHRAPAELPAGLEWHQGEFTHTEDIAAALDGCDLVFHLVSTTIPQTSNENPVYDLESNVVGTLGLLETIRKQQERKKVIYFSSGGTVYGIPRVIPIPEDHPTNPLSAYGVGKLATEKYLELYRVLYDVDYTVLRLANPYGENQRIHSSQGAIPVFMHKALCNETIEIWGDGHVVRDYVYIADVVAAALQAMHYQGPEHVFNVGSGRGTSLLDLLGFLEELLNQRVKRRFLAGRKFDVPANILDVRLAQTHLSWNPDTSLLDGMAKMLIYMRDNLGGSTA